MMEFQALGSLVRDMHASIVHIYYMALPVAILLAVAFGYFRSGAPDYVDTLKRAFVATILLVGFPEISNAIIGVCDGIAQRIDDMSGLDTFIRMAQEKSESYAVAKNVLLLKFNDLFIAVLSFGSFILVYLARYLTIAMYYFFWVFLSAISPLMILFYIFPQTAFITGNLFRGLIQVASWKIVWALLSAMLRALAFGNIYQTEGSYITLIVLNFIIALAMLLTPAIVKSTVGEGTHAMAQSLGAGTVAVMMALPARALLIKTKVVSEATTASRAFVQTYRNLRSKRENQ
jgi:hypothetical protein